MASEAGNIGPESEGAEAAIEFLLDPMNLEKLQGLLSDEVWESFVTSADLSREEIDALYDNLKQLRELIATEDEDMPSTEQLHCERLIKEFPQVKQELQECVGKLYELADKKDEVHRGCTISNVAASSAGAVSGILTIAGLFLAPVTAGSSLVLMGTGVGLGVASAVTSVSTSIVEHAVNKSIEAEANRLVSAGITGNVAMDVLAKSAPKIASLATRCIQSLLCIVKNARAFKVAKACPLLAAKAKVFMTTGAVSVRSSQRLQKAFGGTALTMTKGARIFGAATAGFCLLVDVIDLVKESKHLHEGSKAESAEELRQKARDLEKKLEELTQIHKNLQKGLTLHSREDRDQGHVMD